MIQTLALLVDAYRDLNARKLFWVTLALSGLVMLALGFLGVSGTNLTLAGYHIDMAPVDPVTVYKTIFSYVMIGLWLTWVANVLALVSTGGIFPDLISSGTIDLYLSKPISRLRLFLTKYLTGLLFVALQVGVFSLASFLLFGIRAHSWKPSLFLAVPIVVCMFSYLFGFCVLFGVWTRSTIAAILFTGLVWVLIWGVQFADKQLLTFDVLLKNQIAHNKTFLESADADLAKVTPDNANSFHNTLLRENRERVFDREPDLERNYGRLHIGYQIAHGIKTVVPKTSETNDLLDRWLFSESELSDAAQERANARADRAPQQDAPMGIDPETARQSGEQIREITRHTSLWYVLGTSLLCELIVVSLAAWMFVRRDY